mmetsp:Transcript_15462/g.24725  ORF Transcript_15462/g.24725 Transcript_15462/m.24725 type:complete len:101 (-) Transcript_15462:432-734(-)
MEGTIGTAALSVCASLPVSGLFVARDTWLATLLFLWCDSRLFYEGGVARRCNTDDEVFPKGLTRPLPPPVHQYSEARHQDKVVNEGLRCGKIYGRISQKL